jgi:hypothetical protein
MFASASRSHYSVDVEWPVSQGSMNAARPNQLSTILSNRIVRLGEGEKHSPVSGPFTIQ